MFILYSVELRSKWLIKKNTKNFYLKKKIKKNKDFFGNPDISSEQQRITQSEINELE